MEAAYWGCLQGMSDMCDAYYVGTGHTVIEEVLERGGPECSELGLACPI